MSESYHLEHISFLIPTCPETKQATTLYKSSHSKKVKTLEKENRFDCKTMGKIKTNPPNPKDPVTKGTGDKRRKILADSRRTFQNSTLNRKPAVPTQSQAAPKYAKKSDKVNKIHENAMRNINSVPKKPKNIFVDSCYGNKNETEISGLVPRYVKKVDYGKLPNYIVKRNEEVENAENLYDSYLNEHLKKEAAKEVSEEDRLSLLNSLKVKWDQLNHQYQGLSVVTDTVPKKFKKRLWRVKCRMFKGISSFWRGTLKYLSIID